MDGYTPRPEVMRNTDGTLRRTGKSSNPDIYGTVHAAATTAGLPAPVAARVARWAEVHNWVEVRRTLVAHNATHADPALRAAYYGDS